MSNTGTCRRVSRPWPPLSGNGTVRRRRLPDGHAGKLYFAQVREDPLLELEWLAPGPSDTVLVVSSGGCTALSLLGAGAARVFAVDINTTQNDLVELKAIAVAGLDHPTAVAFLGGAPMEPARRRRLYRRLRQRLSRGAREWWDARPRAVASGALNAGASERLLRLTARSIRLALGRRRIRRLLACRTIEEQLVVFRSEWDNRRWRLLFRLLLNRWALGRGLDPSFFRNVAGADLPDHFLRLAEHGLTKVPVSSNYFLHHILTGAYPVGAPGGSPPYLSDAGVRGVRDALPRLTLVDGSVTSWLRTRPPGSVDRFALSNICEWMSAAEIDALFDQVARTAAPGARLCFRNFVGWTELPSRFHGCLQQHVLRGEAMIWRDRSLVQCRFVPCTVGRTGR